MKTITEAVWRAEAIRLFGADPFKWRFRCPVCGNVAAPEDFRAFADAGATPTSATNECVGRYLPKEKRLGAFSNEHGNPKITKPCDYAGYGLLLLSPVEVEFPDGTKTQSFAFDEVAPSETPGEKPNRKDQPHE